MIQEMNRSDTRKEEWNGEKKAGKKAREKHIFFFYLALALVAALASLTELKTGRPKFSVPPLPGETPPTTVSLLYASACSE